MIDKSRLVPGVVVLAKLQITQYPHSTKDLVAVCMGDGREVYLDISSIVEVLQSEFKIGDRVRFNVEYLCAPRISYVHVIRAIDDGVALLRRENHSDYTSKPLSELSLDIK